MSDHLPMFVIDVLRHDEIETPDSILRLLNDDGCIGWRFCRPCDFSMSELTPILLELVAKGYVTAHREELDRRVIDGNRALRVTEIDLQTQPDEYWFHLTPSGRKLWNSWDPPIEDGA